MNVGYVLKTVLSTFSVLFLVGLLFSCKEDYAYVTPTYVSTAYDSSKPVEITAILPDSGGYKTPFVIKGSNFGNDLSKIKVILMVIVKLYSSVQTERLYMGLCLNKRMALMR